MLARNVVALVLAATCAACATKSVTSEDEAPVPANRDRNLITQTEIDANPSLKASSALDMIKSLRPQYFMERGLQTIRDANAGTSQDPEAGKVHASVNAGRIVALTELSGLHGNEVLEVRFLNSAQAMQRFGTAARSGPIILVTTTKQ